jgi:hypothetical protein
MEDSFVLFAMICFGLFFAIRRKKLAKFMNEIDGPSTPERDKKKLKNRQSLFLMAGLLVIVAAISRFLTIWPKLFGY